MELAEHIAIESTGHRTPNYPNLTDSTLFFASGGRGVVRGSLTEDPIKDMLQWMVNKLMEVEVTTLKTQVEKGTQS